MDTIKFPAKAGVSITDQDRIIRQPEVCQRVGFGKSALYNYIRAGKFPKPIQLGSRSVGWLMSDVTKFIADRVAESRANG